MICGVGTRPHEKSLLLDACGVLVGEPMGPLFATVAASAGRSPVEITDIFSGEFRDDLWGGQTAEDDFWRCFAQACGLDTPTKAWREVVTAAMQPLPAARHLHEWSRHARLILVSNHRYEWLVPVLEQSGLLAHFTDLRISSETGLVKPEPAAYHPALEACLLTSALYVDDKPDNARAAADLGIPTVLADPAGFWMEEVEAWLRT